MTRNPNISAWFLSLVLFVCAIVFITQFKNTGSFVKNILIILTTLLAIIFILWIFFRTGLASWAEKWIKSSYEDFLKEVDKSRSNKLK